MRLLMVTTSFPPVVGGLQTYAVELARRFAARTERFELVAPWCRGARAHDRGLPFAVHRLPELGEDLALSGVLPLRLIAARGGFDGVFATHWAVAHAALRASSGALAQHVFCAVHGKELLIRPFARIPPAQWVYDRVRRKALDDARGLFPVSAHTAGLLGGFGVRSARIVTVPNGVDPERFRPEDARALRRSLGIEGRRVLMTVARLVRRKGVDTVLASLGRVAERVPDVVYLVVGDGPDRGRLEELAHRHGVETHVRFLGRVSGDIARYYNACDVFVMPARAEARDVEGFGLVFLEAGACEKPVVGARAGGVVDAIRHAETGLLVEPDDPAALAEALTGLLEDDERARSLGEAGRARVLREGTWDHAASRILAAMA